MIKDNNKKGSDSKVMKEVLKKNFGYDSFREGQERLISATLEDKDVLGIMPTGAGKSICFQIPAIMKEGITIVVSPLISLMKDQVRALNQAGIHAAYINSSLSPNQIVKALENAKNGVYKIIYVAPERLLTLEFLEFTQSITVAMVTVDEAHCISQWGQDFRPSYAIIPQFIDSFQKRPVVSAFTATATLRVKEDIIALLSLQDPTVLVTGFNRENLYFEVEAPNNKMITLLDFIQKDPGRNGIVYCSTRKTVEAVCEELKAQGYLASRYHAGLSDIERHNNQDDFLFDRVNIMVATNAFGMGIDKSNVAFVVHFNMPKDIESYYQEAGRAGRDGSGAKCLLLYSGQDVRTHQWLIENAKGVTYSDEETEKLLKENEYKRLKEMTFYATTNDCLRKYILKYFGENPPNYCGDCSNCNTKFELIDITDEAIIIIDCTYGIQERFGITMVIDVLRGSKNERLLQLGFDKLSTYGKSVKSVSTLRSIVDHLIQEGYLAKSDGQYPVLGVTNQSQDILSGNKKIEIKLAKEKIKETSVKLKRKNALPENREELYSNLRRLRGKIAKEQGVPAFVIFADNSLVDMCIRLPETSSQFTQVTGVGEVKLERYGSLFLSEISDFCQEYGITERLQSKETKGSKRSKNKKVTKEIVLPNQDTLKEIEISEQLTPVREIANRINITLRQYECTTTSAVKISKWLVVMGYLETIETNEGTTKQPTEQGLHKGIIQDERLHKNRKYFVNQYPKAMQEIIIDNLCEILTET